MINCILPLRVNNDIVWAGKSKAAKWAAMEHDSCISSPINYIFLIYNIDEKADGTAASKMLHYSTLADMRARWVILCSGGAHARIKQPPAGMAAALQYYWWRHRHRYQYRHSSYQRLSAFAEIKASTAGLWPLLIRNHPMKSGAQARILLILRAAD